MNVAQAAILISGLESLYLDELKPNLAVGAIDFLQWAHERSKIYLVSDTFFLRGAMLRRIMQRDAILKFFAGQFFSDETGVQKPNPTAFNSIMMLERCSAQDILHVGDDVRTDCAGARAAGINSILFRGKTKQGDAAQHMSPTLGSVCSFHDLLEKLARS